MLYCIDKKKKIECLTMEEFQSFQPVFQKDILTVLSPEDVVNSKISYGGTSIITVKNAIAEAEAIIKACLSE